MGDRPEGSLERWTMDSTWRDERTNGYMYLHMWDGWMDGDAQTATSIPSVFVRCSMRLISDNRVISLSGWLTSLSFHVPNRQMSFKRKREYACASPLSRRRSQPPAAICAKQASRPRKFRLSRELAEKNIRLSRRENFGLNIKKSITKVFSILS